MCVYVCTRGCRGQRALTPQISITMVFEIGPLTGPGLASKAQESASLHLPRCQNLHGFWVDLMVLTVTYTEKLGLGGCALWWRCISSPEVQHVYYLQLNKEVSLLWSWILGASVGHSLRLQSTNYGWYFVHSLSISILRPREGIAALMALRH